jgi:hypothetical protein
LLIGDDERGISLWWYEPWLQRCLVWLHLTVLEPLGLGVVAEKKKKEFDTNLKEWPRGHRPGR